MVPGISEYFGSDASHVTLSQATVSLQEMGDRVITTQVKVDGGYTPTFNGWYVVFNGEKFVLNTRKPQAAKDTSSTRSNIDLTFESEAISQLKRYYFVEMAHVYSDTYMINGFNASLRLNAQNFITAFNQVLAHYYGASIVMTVAQGVTLPEDVKEVEISYSYVWDVLKDKFFNTYGLNWKMETSNGVTQIIVGAPHVIINHVFQYGYLGGLLRFERQVQDYGVYNQLLGRGGTKNLPYRYFKIKDPENENWNADPNAIPELKDVYFDRLLDHNFRLYVQGWMTNPNRIVESGYPTGTFDQSLYNSYWAYKAGHDDTKFNPPEYVQDESSIETYGIRQGKRDDDDKIYPTIQGVTISPMGRVDEVVAVSSITDGDDGDHEAYETPFDDKYGTTSQAGQTNTVTLEWSDQFSIAEGFIGQFTVVPFSSGAYISAYTIRAVRVSDGVEFAASSIPAGGPYTLKASVLALDGGSGAGTVGFNNVVLHEVASSVSDEYTFNIWIKNVFETSMGSGETALQYSKRVWEPILGDRLGNSAAVIFTTGAMSISEDYNFIIAEWPVYDTSKTLNGVQSHWRLTLKKSDAEYDATGRYIPSATTGGKPVASDKFAFIGIDMPFNYVEWAEEKLTSTKEDELDDISETNPTWVVDLDTVRINTLERLLSDDDDHTLASKIEVGKVMEIYDTRFTGGDILNLGIRSVTYEWNESTEKFSKYPKVSVVLSEKEVEYVLPASQRALDNSQKAINIAKKTPSVVTRTVKQEIGGLGGDVYLGNIVGTVEE